MQSVYWDIALILALILASGIIAMSEFAISLARKSRLRDLASRGYRSAAFALRLSEDPKGLLWTVHASTTLLGTLTGVYAGAYLTPRLANALAQAVPAARYSQMIAVGLIVATISLLSIVLAELVPRRIALVRPERIARLFSRPIRALATVAVPLIGLLSRAIDRGLRVVGIRPRPEPPVTQEEISILLREGTKAGVFEEGEHEMIKRVFRFSDRRAQCADDSSQGDRVDRSD